MNNENLMALTKSVLGDVGEENDRKYGEDLVNRVLIHKKELDQKLKKESVIGRWDVLL